MSVSAANPLSLLRRLGEKVANEPVVAIAGTVSAAVTWLFTYVVSGWDPTQHAQQIAGLATASAFALSFIARQFVTPARKVAAIPVPAPVVLDTARVLSPDPVVVPAPAPVVDDTPYPFDTTEAAQAALDARPVEAEPAAVEAT